MGSVSALGPWHMFQSYSLNGGRDVALRLPVLGDSQGAILKRYEDGLQYMSPMDYSVTEFSTLGYDAGCFQAIDYEILEVVFDNSGQDLKTYTPNLVDSVDIINDSGLPVERHGKTKLQDNPWLKIPRHQLNNI